MLEATMARNASAIRNKKVKTIDLASDLLRTNRVLCQMSHQIVLQQQKLQRVVTPRAWQVYLRLEEPQSDRLVALSDRLLRRCRQA
jgi:hypothetical protein